jgi:hypothetical protein
MDIVRYASNLSYLKLVKVNDLLHIVLVIITFLPGLALPLDTAIGSDDVNKCVSLPQARVSCSLKNSTGSSALGDNDSPCPPESRCIYKLT